MRPGRFLQPRHDRRRSRPTRIQSFEVATIKPSKPGTRGAKAWSCGIRGTFAINYNFSVAGYDFVRLRRCIGAQELRGAPDWVESWISFDIQATPEPAGQPNRKQIEDYGSESYQ